MTKVSLTRPRASSRGWLAGLVAAACVVPDTRRDDTVLYASGADLQSINPLVAIHPLAKQVQNHVLFVTVAAYDSTLTPGPRLADWRWNADRTSLDLTLRGDVFWHDGPRTTARDVVMTVGYARDPATGYPRHHEFARWVDVREVDSNTVRIRFDGPQPVFPDVLTDLAILPAHHLFGVAPSALRTHDFNRTPVGNGPFRFVEHRPNQRWVFERAAAFPDALGPATFGRLVVVVVDEAATKLAALTSGELDFAGINPAHAGFVRADPRLEVVDYPAQFAVGLVWNLRRPRFASRAVRRALTMALDRATLIDAYVYGFGEIADGPVSPGHPWAEPPAPVPYDPRAAAALLDSLGWRVGPDGIRGRDGRRMEFDLLAVSSGDNALEQLIQAQLARVGIGARLRLLELATFLDLAQSPDRDFDALVVGVPGTLSLGHVRAMYSPGGPLAYPGYRSVPFERVLAQVDRAESPDALSRAWRVAQARLVDDLPTTWLYHSRGVQGKNRRVHAPRPDLRGELARMREWSIASTNQ